MRLSCLTLLVLIACGGGDDEAPSQSTAVFSSLSLAPPTATVGVGGTVQLSASPRDQNGAAISGLPAASFTSSDVARASVSQSGLVTALASGSATITASLTAQGQTRSAGSQITITPPSTQADVTVSDNFFQASSVTVVRDQSAGALVRWTWTGQNSHNVTFDAGAPNSATQTTGTFSRTFTTAGSFTYFCTVHGRGMSGTVVVQ
ncbi:MAG: Ig-like domain-containing protein [Gemmatimonadota bacterium]